MKLIEIAAEKVRDPRRRMPGKPQVHLLHEQRRQIQASALSLSGHAPVQHGHATQTCRTAQTRRRRYNHRSSGQFSN